jgi:FkbM family methyltransferase
MKALIKSLLRYTPYQVVKKNRRISMTQVLEHLRPLGLDPQTVIDVGVGYGTSELYLFPDAEYLLIEAVREFEPHMQKILKHRKGRYLIAAAGSAKGELSIKVRPADLQASTLFQEAGGGDGSPRNVPVVTIDEVAPPGSVLLKLDIQGAELLALAGATETLKRCDAVLMEVQVMPCLTDAPSFADVVSFMRERNFVVYDFFGGAYRPLDGAVVSIDIAFVQEDGKFRRNRAYEAKRAA